MRLSALLLVVLSPGLAASGAYGMKFDPGDPADASGTTFVPVNANVFRLRQTDGTERFFVRDEDEPELLHGERPWLAELDGARALVMTDPEFKGGETGFMFLSGRLRKLLVDGSEYDIPASAPKTAAEVSALWPKAGCRLRADEAPDIWKDGKRLRLWFDNPNKAGLLFAELVLAGLAVVFLKPVVCRICGAAAVAAAFAGLVATSSRGALLALLCGLSAAALTRLKMLLSLKTIIALAVVMSVAAACVAVLGQGNRLVRNLFVEGQHETSRLTVWKVVPQMMADAPGGWGFGQSARAYTDWYQERNDCLLKNLISGHLTFLVETGWVTRFAYFAVWAALLIAAFVLALRGSSPLPFAVLVAFAVAACFNPVLTVPELVAMPFLATVTTVAGLRRLTPFVKRGIVLVSFVVALVSIGGAYAAGTSGGRLRTVRGGVKIAGDHDFACVNGECPEAWVVHDDYVLHGGYWWMFGKEVRRHYRAHPAAAAVAFTRRLDAVPAKVGTLVLVGEAARDYLAAVSRPAADRTVLVSPPFGWRSVPEGLLKATDLTMVVGALVADGKDAPAWVKTVPGAELYIPGWLDFTVQTTNKEEKQ